MPAHVSNPGKVFDQLRNSKGSILVCEGSSRPSTTMKTMMDTLPTPLAVSVASAIVAKRFLQLPPSTISEDSTEEFFVEKDAESHDCMRLHRNQERYGYLWPFGHSSARSLATTVIASHYCRREDSSKSKSSLGTPIAISFHSNQCLVQYTGQINRQACETISFGPSFAF